MILLTLAENHDIFAIFVYCNDYQRDMVIKPKSLYINQEVEKIQEKIKNNCLKTCEYQQIIVPLHPKKVRLRWLNSAL